MIDTQTSIKNDLIQMSDLTNTCTANQKEIYPLIDNLASGKIQKVEMKGEQAKIAFGRDLFVNSEKIEISIEQGVDFWVNASKDDFTKYMTRTRIK